MTKPKQVAFQKVKPEDMPLNGKQLDMLALIADAGLEGAIVYGRGPTETVEALCRRELVTFNPTHSVVVLVMGKLERRWRYVVTEKGKAHVGEP